MENEEMMNRPDEENNAFEDSSYDNANGYDGDDNDRIDEKHDKDGWYEDPNAKASGSPRVKRLLDELTDDGSDDVDSRDEDGLADYKDPALQGLKDVSGLPPRTAEEEEMELLKHVKSERGRERIKSIISARKEAEVQKTEAQSRVDHFENVLSMTGLDDKDLAQTMEYGRLVGKGDERSLELALNMLEQQRETICKKLGRTAPGVDLLSDFPDLKRAVDNKELLMDHALKLAKYEREESMNRQYQEDDMQRILKSESLIGSLSDISSSCDNFFRRYEGEADYPAKMQRITQYFADPDRMNTFLKTIPPTMWFNHMKFLYENISASPRNNDYAPAQQPLRSRSMATGSVADNPNMSNLDRILRRMDDMGI